VTPAAPRRLLALAAALLLGAAGAGPALAHASLLSSTPTDGSTVTVSAAATVTLAFDNDLDATKSRFDLVDGAGSVVAAGRVGADPRAMTASGLALAPGAYQARWTAVASDGDLTRGVVGFRVVLDGADPSAGAAIATPGASTGSPGSSVADGSSSDVLVPILAAVAVISAAAVVLLRRGRGA
jgi:copper transport protein